MSVDKLNASNPGALVLGGDYQGLGIVRSIGRHGAPVCVIDNERSIARYSRFTGTAAHVRELPDDHRLVNTLLDVGRRHGLRGWILFPTRDEHVAAIAHHRDELAEYFRVPTPAWDTIRWAWDKRNTHTLATELGIPVPWTFWSTDENELDSLEITFPVVVKPAIKERFVRATRAKAWRADNRQELSELYRRARAIVPNAEVMLQELIPGNGLDQYAYCAFFKNGEALASMQVRRRRQHPHEFGRASTFVETVDCPELVEPSLRFLRQIDYYGLVELEYKRDRRDGTLRLLDVNARTWGYHSLGAAAGVDFPALLFQDQLGIEPRGSKARAGVSWLRLLTDLPTGLLDIRARRLGSLAYLRSLRRMNTEAVWARDDLRPWFAELALVPYLAAKRGF